MSTVEAEVVQAIAPRQFPDYSHETKAETIILAQSIGAYKAHQQTGIPWQTIYRWLDQADRYSKGLHQNKLALADKLEKIANQSADLLLEDRLETANTRELLGAIHITIPAMQLLRGQPTEIRENVERAELSIILQTALDATNPQSTDSE